MESLAEPKLGLDKRQDSLLQTKWSLFRLAWFSDLTIKTGYKNIIGQLTTH